MIKTLSLSMLAGALLLSGGAGAQPFPSTYEPLPSSPTLIINATILTGDGQRLDDASLLMVDGAIAFVGDGEAPDGVEVIDAEGRWVTPGLIDVHSHLGVYPSPGVAAHSDGNEMTNPVTANVWAEHSIWPQDPGFATALAGGVTSLQVLPGSANLIGGRAVTLKNVYATSYQQMKFPGAPYGIENGLRRKSEARLWQQGPGAGHTHGQRGRLPRPVDRRPEIPG